ncbi:MAG: NADPH-dependent F420 reductase [Candidatus Nanopelagicales bacterium]|nr:NADPH-dependent F420 reductase [Candidatus Nanopelagicales bacterium]
MELRQPSGLWLATDGPTRFTCHMRIGIVGAGLIGGTLAGSLPGIGHTILLANSRGPESLRQKVASLGPNVSASTVAEAAAADLVIVTIPLGAVTQLPAAVFAGRTVVDTCNYYPDRDGRFPELDSASTTSSELVGRHLPGARLVKAFNTIYFERLRDGGRPDLPIHDRLAIPVASDDEEAKATVSRLIEDLGFAPVDNGSLANGGRQEPGTAVYNVPVGPAEARQLLGIA